MRPKTDIHAAAETADAEKPASQVVEAALFMAVKPLKMEELMRISGIGSLGYLGKVLESLQEEYSQRGIEIVSTHEGWQMQVKGELLPKVANLTPHADLPDGCKKTLAIVIYKEPLKQSELVKMQGNKIYEYVKELEGRGLVKSERLGHTKMLKVTHEFEAYFGETKEQIKERIRRAVEEPLEKVDKTEQAEVAEKHMEQPSEPLAKKTKKKETKEKMDVAPILPHLKELTVDDLKSD